MSRYKRFTFLCNKDERHMISVLADELQRSQSDTVRFVIREAIKRIAIDPENHQRIGLNEKQDEN